MLEQAIEVRCPKCWEPTRVWIDHVDGELEVATDCEICCRPLHVRVVMRAGELVSVTVGRGW